MEGGEASPTPTSPTPAAPHPGPPPINRFINFELSSTINVYVGQQRKAFLVHAHLMERSKYFYDAMHDEWHKSEERYVELDAEDPEVFAAYLNLVYFNHVPINFSSEDTYIRLEESFTTFARIYVLADVLSDSTAKNDLTRRIYYTSRDPAAAPRLLKAIDIIYEGTMGDGPLRKLLADIWTDCNSTSLRLFVDHFPHAFLGDLAVALRGLTNGLTRLSDTNGVDHYMEA